MNNPLSSRHACLLFFYCVFFLSITFILFLSFLFNYVYVCLSVFLCMCTSVPVPMEARGVRYSRIGLQAVLISQMWVQGIELGSSGRAASASNCSVSLFFFSSAQDICYLLIQSPGIRIPLFADSIPAQTSSLVFRWWLFYHLLLLDRASCS